MKCLCIGICQLAAVVKILKKNPTFTSAYSEILAYEVFNLTVEEMQQLLDEVVPTCDLVISQPVSSSYKGNPIFATSTLRERVRTGATHLVLPNCYFTGYDPVPFQATDANHGITSSEGISYFPSLCLEQLLRADVKEACITWCDENYYTPTEIKNNYSRSLAELKLREARVFENDFGVDVRISDYIEANYRNLFLFHTYNHPTNLLLFELTRRLLEKLGLPSTGVEEGTTTELLGDVSIPPSLSVYTQSGFSFKYPSFVFFGRSYTTFEAMTRLSKAIAMLPPALHQQWRCCVAYGRNKLH